MPRTTPPVHQTLFPPASTDPVRCPSCGTTRKNLCRHSADLRDGTVEPLARRPRGCLDSAQLGPDDDWPEGF